jgi:hypothetical protein
MTTPEKEIPAQREPSRDRRRDKNLLTGTLSTAACAVCFLLAFTYLHGIEQLLLVSLGGMLAGGVR